MAPLQLLRFATPSIGQRSKLGRGPGPRINFPTHVEQSARLTPEFKGLLAAFQRKRATASGSAKGVRPEQVIVLEIVGSIEGFAAAVQRIGGMEWIGELDALHLEPAHGFEVDNKPEAKLGAKVYMTFASQYAMRQMLDFVERFGEDPQNIPSPFKSWAGIIGHIYSARVWSAIDRVKETGVLEDWGVRIDTGNGQVPCEVELWYKHHIADRQIAEREVAGYVDAIGGIIIKRSVIEEIRYHGLLIRLPPDVVTGALEDLANLDEIELFKCDGIRYFRPVGQCVVSRSLEANHESAHDLPLSPCDMSLPPTIALFDGMPLQSHRLLQDRMVVDDPDDFESSYQVLDREHGTAMASLICHGDIREYTQSLNRPIYMRPVMKSKNWLGDTSREFIPDDEIAVDLIHRSVLRLYEDSGIEGPVAPSIQVINISVCDASRPFDNRVSPLARLLDYLSWKYNVLFIVSAGNHDRAIELGVKRGEFKGLNPDQLEVEVMKAVADDGRNRRLLSPAETLNGLTIGATHEDASVVTNPRLIDPFQRLGLPSVSSARGPGFRRAIKPDLHLPGGRQFVTEKLGNTHEFATLELHKTNSPPGQTVAVPGPPGNISNTTFARGSSNAAAAATRNAQQLHDILAADSPPGLSGIPATYYPVLIKAMLVHGSNWDDSLDLLNSVLQDHRGALNHKEQIGWLLGNGNTDVSRAIGCTEERATILGFGEVKDGASAKYLLPCPQSLSSTREKRRLTVTLAWFSPINVRRSEYRGIQLWFDVIAKEKLMLGRPFADYRSVRRGTVQHEIFEGDRLVAINPGDHLDISVNCRADGGHFPDRVKFGLFATLEVEPGIGFPIYQEVRDQLAVRITV